MDIVDKELRRLRKRAEEDGRFSKTPAFEVANYFRVSLKKFGYTISQANWDKSKKAVEDAFISHPNVSIQDWKKCIDWVFSERRFLDSFWRTVTVYHFGTIVKMYNAYKTYSYAKGNGIQKKRINYGRLKNEKQS